MPTYKLCSLVTISVHTEVEADSLEEAIAIANERGLSMIHDEGDPTEEWVTSGELDGTIGDIEES